MASLSEEREAQQKHGKHTGFLDFLISRFFKFQRSPKLAPGAKSIPVPGQEAESPTTDKQVLQGSPRPTGAEGNIESEQEVPVARQLEPIKTKEESGTEQSLSSGETVESANTDSSDWNFSRRSARSQRSAREWQRGSALNLSDWDNVQQSFSQQSDGISPEFLVDNADSKEVGNIERGNGKASEKSSIRTQPVQRRYLTRGKVSLERGAMQDIERSPESQAHKRKSIEAGLQQSSRNTADKVGRLSAEHTAQHSDFYPTELQERSILFNSRSAPSS